MSRLKKGYFVWTMRRKVYENGGVHYLLEQEKGSHLVSVTVIDPVDENYMNGKKNPPFSFRTHSPDSTFSFTTPCAMRTTPRDSYAAVKKFVSTISQNFDSLPYCDLYTFQPNDWEIVDAEVAIDTSSPTFLPQGFRCRQ